MIRKISLFICLAAVSSQFGCNLQQNSSGNLEAGTEKKIDTLLAEMTIEEKVGQMTQFTAPAQDDLPDIKNKVRKGEIGSFLNITDVRQRNRLQKLAVEKSRLGIPLIFGYDVIHGYRTIFPIPLAEAATWDTDLMEETAKTAAREAGSVGIDWTFAPMLDISRDPRWGRIAESPGEDSYLGSQIAKAKVRGYQGTDLSAPDTIAACLKHFAVYGAAQAGRDYHTTNVPVRTVRNVYLPPFKAGIEEGAATVMSAFNDLNGIPATANKFLLTDVLRKEWNFDGFVLSDWNAVKELIPHGIAGNETRASLLAVKAGVDMEMVSRCYRNLPKLVKEGKISEAVLDTAVRRILRIKFRAGLFENPYADPAREEKVILAGQHRRLARQAVRESLVLAKNKNNVLPIGDDIESIALIGPLADNKTDLLGTWAAMGNPEDVVTVKEGLENIAGDIEINYAKGCDIIGDSTKGFSQAVKTAENSELVIMCLGESAAQSGEAHSRTNLDIPGMQLKLLKEIHKTGKPVALVLFTGRPLTINWELENIDSIVIAWHPGIEGGNGIADVLCGKYNPSGKITATFPRRVGQIPLYYNMKNTGRPFEENNQFTSGYIDCPPTPLLPFGYGLSYTDFDDSNLKVRTGKVEIPGTVTVSADITNTGDMPGNEVVQLYVRDMVGSVTRPVKELKGFRKIHLKPGQTKTVTFNIPTDNLKFYDKNMKYSVEPGNFKVWIGPNSAEGLEGDFELL